MRIAVLGGGPAGAFAGEKLAAAGFPVTILDEKLAWEKPCGGGLTAKALEQYPFLTSGEAPMRLIERAVLVAGNGARTSMHLRRPIAIYSRQVLNGLLLGRARRAGAEVIRDRVVAIERQDGGWSLAGKDGAYTADFCIVATGARNPLRQMGTEFHPRDSYVALGYYSPGSIDHIEIQFLEDFEGYIWIFPRVNHLSVGICGKIDPGEGEFSANLRKNRRWRLARRDNYANLHNYLATGAAGLRQRVERYMADKGIPVAGSKFYCHLLPSLEAASFDRNRVAGDGWAAVGDAAGLVDPITGEGLYYALRSADLLAACLREGRVADYPVRVRREVMDDLRFGARLARRFYRGRFLLGPVTTRMIEFCRHSPTFQDLIQDLIAGGQGYAGLKARLWRQLVPSLKEIAVHYLLGRTTDVHESLPLSRPV